VQSPTNSNVSSLDAIPLDDAAWLLKSVLVIENRSVKVIKPADVSI
jgi:hypothetical protein